MRRKQLNPTHVRTAIVIVLVFAFTFGRQIVEAAYFIVRPILVDSAYGHINQSYLYGEPNPNNPNVLHRGVDFPSPYGRTVYAVADGVVVNYREDILDNTNPYAWGNFVLVRHNQRHYDRTAGQNAYVYSLYMHLRRNGVLVNVGDPVIAGQGIGEVDNTGNSSGGSVPVTWDAKNDTHIAHDSSYP